MRRLILFVAVAALALSACGGSSGGGTPTTTAMPGLATCTAASATQGVVCGKAVAADGTTPLAGAEVQISGAAAQTLSSITSKGVENPNQCVADTSGDFACQVPVGTTGSTDFIVIFSGFENKSFSADITAGATTDAGTQTMSGSTSERWVVVPGSFDGVQVLLAQLKGCTLSDGAGSPFDPTTGTPSDARSSDDCMAKGLLVLDDFDTTSEYFVSTFLMGASLTDYSSLFVNCDAYWGDNGSGYTGVTAAVQAFSTAGGHVYWSDLADRWLTETFPSVITFGPHTDGTGTGYNLYNTTASPPNISAEVAYPPLATIIGTPIDVTFDLPVWADMDSVTTAATTYIRGDISALSTLTGTRPIAVGWRPGASTGCVFYTSYHIEIPGSDGTTPQELAIKYLVQNIESVCQ